MNLPVSDRSPISRLIFRSCSTGQDQWQKWLRRTRRPQSQLRGPTVKPTAGGSEINELKFEGNAEPAKTQNHGRAPMTDREVLHAIAARLQTLIMAAHDLDQFVNSL